MADDRTAWKEMSSINRDLLAPLQSATPAYFLLLIVLGAIVALGAGAWYYQVDTGIGQTNLHPPIFWGVYIASFIFWVGASHSGTFISGVLRLSKAEWRRPVTRIAELMTFISLMIATLFVFFHLGRVWRWYYLMPYPNQRELWPNFRSPLMWDAIAVFTYATSSTIYLYLPLIPDFALLRERIGGWRKPLYRVLSLGWTGTQNQWQVLETALRIITPLIVMVMVSVHSIVGWDFGVSLVPAWHSTIFAPYFVVGAVHSGVGLVAIGLYVLRKIYRLERYIESEHFDKIGKLLVVTTLVLAYLYFAELLTIWYAKSPDHMWVVDALLIGPFAVPFLVHGDLYLLHPARDVDEPGLSPVAVGRHARRCLYQHRHVYRACPDPRAAIVLSPTAVQLGKLLPVLGGNDHHRGIVGVGGSALCSGRQVCPGDFHLGRKGRPRPWNPSRNMR